jgi:hypothetical protein
MFYVMTLSVAKATHCSWQLDSRGKILTGEIRNSARKDVLPLLLCPENIEHGLTRDRTLSFEDGVAMKHLSHGMDRCLVVFLIQSVSRLYCYHTCCSPCGDNACQCKLFVVF